MDGLTFRSAVPGDAAALGALHVASWHETYAGILPDALLAGLSVDARAAIWAEMLGDPAANDGTSVWLAEDGERLIGFGACGEQRDRGLAEAGFGGEIGAIYILRAYQNLGIGRSIMRHLAQSLLERGHRAAGLWVLRENLAARRFYERLGGIIVGEKKEERPEATLVELAYGWADLGALIR